MPSRMHQGFRPFEQLFQSAGSFSEQVGGLHNLKWSTCRDTTETGRIANEHPHQAASFEKVVQNLLSDESRCSGQGNGHRSISFGRVESRVGGARRHLVSIFIVFSNAAPHREIPRPSAPEAF